MSVKVTRTVHSVHQQSFPMAAKTADGRDVQAMVPGLVVELVGERHTHTETIVPSSDQEMIALKDLFVRGRTISVTYDVASQG